MRIRGIMQYVFTGKDTCKNVMKLNKKKLRSTNAEKMGLWNVFWNE